MAGYIPSYIEATGGIPTPAEERAAIAVARTKIAVTEEEEEKERLVAAGEIPSWVAERVVEPVAVAKVEEEYVTVPGITGPVVVPAEMVEGFPGLPKKPEEEWLGAPVSLPYYKAERLTEMGLPIEYTGPPRYVAAGMGYVKKMELTPEQEARVRAEGLIEQEYIKKYGREAYYKSLGVEQVAQPLFVPARALYPEVRVGEITPLEWGIGAGQAALWTMPIWGPAAGRAAAPVIRRIPFVRRFAPLPTPPPPPPVVRYAKTVKFRPEVRVGGVRARDIGVEVPEVQIGGVARALLPEERLVPHVLVGPEEAAFGPVYGWTREQIFAGGARIPARYIGPKRIPIEPEWTPFVGGGRVLAPPRPVIGAPAVRVPTVATMTEAQLARFVVPAPVAARPIIVPTVAPIVEPVVTPVVRPAVRPVVVPVVRPIVRPVVEPVVVPAVTPIVAPAPVPIVKPAPVPLPKPIVHPWVAPAPIVAPTPAIVPMPAPAPMPVPVPIPALVLAPAPGLVTPITAPAPPPIPPRAPAPPAPPFWWPEFPSLRKRRPRVKGVGLLKGPLGVWEFGRAELYIPGARGPVMRPRGFGAVKPRRSKVGITGPTRITGSDVGYAGRAYVPATGA